MSVVTMGLVTTAFCLWAESFALQNVDASVVSWRDNNSSVGFY